VSSSTFLVFEDRPSDSPFVERIWRSHSTRAGQFLSVAASHCELVISSIRGKVTATLRGPETKVSSADCPADGEWFGIRFALGAYLPRYPAAILRDRNDVELPATSRSFWLQGAEWEQPDFENAESLVTRLVAAGVLARDSAVSAALGGDEQALSKRSAQRHFVAATGMTHRTHRQIHRARHAANLLRRGVAIQDTVHEAGYFDQAHLTRSLRFRIGETPGQVARHEQQLSFLYKTDPHRSA
jgi:AraC-like DNA-binding protein